MRSRLFTLGLISIAATLLWWLFRDDTASPVIELGRGYDVGTTSPSTGDSPTAPPRVAVPDQVVPVVEPTASSPPPPAHAVRVQLRGRVVDALSSRPLANAEITVMDGGHTAATTDDGSYQLDFFLAARHISVECTHPSHLSSHRILWNRRVPKGGTVAPFDFELLPRNEGATLIGRILDERGVPARRARVSLQRTPPSRRGSLTSAQPREAGTDSNGRFAFEELLPGRWNLLAEAPGLADHELNRLELPRGSRTDVGVIRLARFGWARFAGRVIDAEGAAVPGVTIRVRQVRGTRTTTSDPHGAFAIDRIEAGLWPVGFEHDLDRGGLGSLEFGARQTVRRDITLEGGPHFIGGQVLLGDIPTAGLEVMVEIANRETSGWMAWRTHTDRDGRFRIAGLPPGRLDLGFTRERPYASFEQDGVAADRDDHRFVFAATPRPVSLTGVVRDSAGTPIEGASVAPFEPLHDETRDRTGPNGRYRIDIVLSTDMTNMIVADRPGYLAATEVVARDMVDADGRIGLDFTLRSEDRVGAVEGVITDEHDHPLRGVECIGRSKSDSGIWSTHTDSTGRFRLDGVTPGKIELILRHRDYRDHSEPAGRVEPRGTLSVAIALNTLQRFARTVLVRGSGGEPVPGVTVDVWRGHHIMAALTDDAGRATLRNVPSSAIELSVEADGYARHSMAHVIDGPRDTELVFQLTRGSATLAGTLVTTDGQTRDDAEVIVRRRPTADEAGVEAIIFSDGEGRFRVEHLQNVDYDVLVWTGSGQSSRAARPDRGPLRVVVDGK